MKFLALGFYGEGVNFFYGLRFRNKGLAFKE